MRINKSELMKNAWKKSNRLYEVYAGGQRKAGVPVTYNKKSFFAASLKWAWEQVKENVQPEQMQQLLKTKEKSTPRELVRAGQYRTGEKRFSSIITGLGKQFRPNVDMFSAGITPDTEWVQYIYFN